MKRLSRTAKIELVETHNILLSLNRLHEANNTCWKRAFYHALCMSDACFNWDERKKIREALTLP